MAVAEVAEEAEEGALLPGGALGGSMSAGSPPLLHLLLQLDQRKAAALLGLLVKRCAYGSSSSSGVRTGGC